MISFWAASVASGLFLIFGFAGGMFFALWKMPYGDSQAATEAYRLRKAAQESNQRLREIRKIVETKPLNPL